MSLPFITVIIPTYRGLHWLPGCIASLRRQTFRDFEIVVVDDASTDGSLDWLRQQPDVRVIRNDTNVGFSVACNQAIRATDSEFVALLNDDTEVNPHWLEALLRPMQGEVPEAGTAATIGMCASLMVRGDDPNIIDNAGGSIDRAAIEWSRMNGEPISVAQMSSEVFAPSGGAVLYRRSMLNDIGLLDERFFAYFEDTDLAWRARRAGWRCWYVSQAVVVHFGSATFGDASVFKIRLLTRNRLWMILKNARLRDVPLIAIYECVSIISSLVRGHDINRLRWTIEALRDAGPFLKERRQRHLRNGNDANVTSCMDDIVWPWHVMRRFKHYTPTPPV